MAKSTAETFGLDWPISSPKSSASLWSAAAFFSFAYKPILKMLAERRQRIADGLANAEKIKQELARTEPCGRKSWTRPMFRPPS